MYKTEKIEARQLAQKNIKTLINLTISIAYGLLLSSLSNNLFRDRNSYIRYAENIDFIKNRFQVDTIIFNEPVFWLYNKFLLTFFSPDLIPKVGVFIIAFSIAFLILKHSKSVIHSIIGITLLFYVPFTFHLQLVVLRQGIASAMLLWAVYFLWENKLKFLIFCFFLGLLHVSFFIVFSVLLMNFVLEKFIKSPLLKISIIGVFFYSSSFILVTTARDLGVRQAQSDGLTTVNSGGGGFILFLFMLSILYFKGLNNVFRDKYAQVATLGIIIYLAFYFTLPVSGRIISTFMPFLYIYMVSTNNLKILTASLIFLCINIYIFKGAISGGSLTSYGEYVLNKLLTL